MVEIQEEGGEESIPAEDKVECREDHVTNPDGLQGHGEQRGAVGGEAVKGAPEAMQGGRKPEMDRGDEANVEAEEHQEECGCTHEPKDEEGDGGRNQQRKREGEEPREGSADLGVQERLGDGIGAARTTGRSSEG